MLDFASPGQLPGQPPGPFQPTDVSSFDDLVDAGGDVFTGCIRARGVGILPDLHFGWVRAGEFLALIFTTFAPDLEFLLIAFLEVGQNGNIGVFFTGTKSQIDRSIPRGVHP